MRDFISSGINYSGDGVFNQGAGCIIVVSGEDPSFGDLLSLNKTLIPYFVREDGREF